MYKKLVSQKLSSFCEKYGLLPAAQFAYRKGLGCTDALHTISHHLQKSLDPGMESYIIQLDFSAAFYRVSHSGPLFKLISIDVGVSMLSIYNFFSDRCERAPTLLFIIYTSEMFELVRTDYLPTTPHYWQLFASQQADLLLPLLTGTWLGFRSGAITCA